MNKKIIYSLLILSVLIIYFINLNTQINKISISNDTLDQISQINWNNKDNLIKMGFTEYENEYYYIDSINDNFFRIVVTKSQDTTTGLSKYKHLSYKFEESSSLGKLSIKRLWTDEIFVTRRYSIYVNDMLIYMLEDNIEGSPYLFEAAIEKIINNSKE